MIIICACMYTCLKQQVQDLWFMVRTCECVCVCVRVCVA